MGSLHQQARVISLLDDDDYCDDDGAEADAISRALSISLRQGDGDRRPHRRPVGGLSDPSRVISLLSDDEDDGGGGLSSDNSTYPVAARKDVKRELRSSEEPRRGWKRLHPTEDEEVQIVAPATPLLTAANSRQNSSSAGNSISGGDCDVEEIGTTNSLRLPHMRQHCPDNRFVQDVVAMCGGSHGNRASFGFEHRSIATNERHCE